MRYFLTNALSPLNYVSCGNLLSKQDFLHPRRNLDCYVLIMVKEGTLYINQEGRNYEIHPYQYIYLKANEEHFGYAPSAGKLSYLWVHFWLNGEDTVIQEDALLFNNSTKELRKPMNDNYIMPEYGEISMNQKTPLLFNQLLDLSRNDNIYSEQMLNYALSLLIMEISQEFVDKHSNNRQNIPPNVAKIMDWIKANYYQSLSVTSLAKEFGYNPDYLSAVFKKSTNTSLVHFINKTRVEVSKSLLINYDLSIKEAAFSCGFTDEKYFMKTFKKYETMTPSQYKKAFVMKRIN